MLSEWDRDDGDSEMAPPSVSSMPAPLEAKASCLFESPHLRATNVYRPFLVIISVNPIYADLTASPTLSHLHVTHLPPRRGCRFCYGQVFKQYIPEDKRQSFEQIICSILAKQRHGFHCLISVFNSTIDIQTQSSKNNDHFPAITFRIEKARPLLPKLLSHAFSVYVKLRVSREVVNIWAST
ncbi:hypothetical protein Bca101_019911 [Brassica carinata]